MILWHEKTMSCLHLPAHMQIEGPFVPINEPLGTSFLVVQHPLAWLKECYVASGSLQEFKHWFRASPPMTQASVLPEADEALRLEWIQADIREALGIEVPLPPEIVRRVHVCLASRAAIRLRYAVDYSLGDYD